MSLKLQCPCTDSNMSLKLQFPYTDSNMSLKLQFPYTNSNMLFTVCTADEPIFCSAEYTASFSLFMFLFPSPRKIYSLSYCVLLSSFRESSATFVLQFSPILYSLSLVSAVTRGLNRSFCICVHLLQHWQGACGPTSVIPVSYFLMWALWIRREAVFTDNSAPWRRDARVSDV
jgi:hypothetical protein